MAAFQLDPVHVVRDVALELFRGNAPGRLLD